MSDLPEDVAKAQAASTAHQWRILAVPSWWLAGIVTLAALGPGLELQPVVVLPIAAAVAAVSLIPMWKAYTNWGTSMEAIETLQAHTKQAELKKLKGDLAAVPTDPEGEMARATRKLLARIRELAQGDAAVLASVDAAQEELSSAAADVEMFQAALEADGAIAPDEEPNDRLVQALKTREIEVADLVGAIRELHAALTLKDDSAGPVLAGLQTVLDKADAEVEVRELGIKERRRRQAASTPQG